MESVGHASDTALQQDKDILQHNLEEFVEVASKKDVLGCCLLIDGRIAAATASWWQRLHWREINLLLVLAHTLPRSVLCCDIPIFLPYFRIANKDPGTVMCASISA